MTQPDLFVEAPWQRHSATDEEIGDWLGLGGNTVRPRRRELQLAGLIRDSGRTRATASGRQAVVWIAV